MEANARVERSLFMWATGYDIEVERHVSSPDGPMKVREIEHTRRRRLRPASGSLIEIQKGGGRRRRVSR
jgi:hypothetical protein